MTHRLPVVVVRLKEGGYLARCEEVRATAMGDTTEEAIDNLREAIEEMIEEYGQEAVFQDVASESEVRVIEVAV
jgi:predicted RNase H-like HicB family nuclease